MSAPFHAAEASHRERDASYGGVVAQLAERWRVVVCRDGLQWIVQRRKGDFDGRRADWRAVSFHRERASLLRACAASTASCDPAALARLAMLPALFGGGG